MFCYVDLALSVVNRNVAQTWHKLLLLNLWENSMTWLQILQQRKLKHVQNS